MAVGGLTVIQCAYDNRAHRGHCANGIQVRIILEMLNQLIGDDSKSSTGNGRN